MPVEYAHALSSSVKRVTEKRDVDALVDSLVEVLTKAGKLKALPAILKEYERISEKSTAVKPTLAVARESQRDAALKELMESLDAIPKNITVTIDNNLIGGWRYADKDTLVDASHKAALLALYRRVTTI